MTKEEFREKVESLRKEQVDLQIAIEKICLEYIDERKHLWPLGAKVELCDKHYQSKRYGIVKDYKLCGDEVWPILAKIKKDGTPHPTATVHLWGDDLRVVE